MKFTQLVILTILIFSNTFSVFGQNNEEPITMVIAIHDESNQKDAPEQNRASSKPPYMIIILEGVPFSSVPQILALQDGIAELQKKLGMITTPEDYEKVSEEILQPYTKKFQDAGVQDIIVEFPRVSDKQFKMSRKISV